MNGTYGDCEKCGWAPETENKRKQAFRREMEREALEEKRAREAELMALPAKHDDCGECIYFRKCGGGAADVPV